MNKLHKLEIYPNKFSSCDCDNAENRTNLTLHYGYKLNKQLKFVNTEQRIRPVNRLVDKYLINICSFTITDRETTSENLGTRICSLAKRLEYYVMCTKISKYKNTGFCLSLQGREKIYHLGTIRVLPTF